MDRSTLTFRNLEVAHLLKSFFRLVPIHQILELVLEKISSSLSLATITHHF